MNRGIRLAPVLWGERAGVPGGRVAGQASPDGLKAAHVPAAAAISAFRIERLALSPEKKTRQPAKPIANDFLLGHDHSIYDGAFSINVYKRSRQGCVYKKQKRRALAARLFVLPCRR